MGGSRHMTCKRCGGKGHFVKKCRAPRVDGGRPDLERMMDKLDRGEWRVIGAGFLRTFLNYTLEVEAHRRVLIADMQRVLTKPRPAEEETELAAVRKRFFRLARAVRKRKADADWEAIRILVDMALEEASTCKK